jgi:hypothetical protein
MTELVLSKVPVSGCLDFDDGTCRPLEYEWVVGINLPASKPIWEHGYVQDGTELEESLAIDTYTADRITDFYEQTRARKKEEWPFYSCHVLAMYAMGSLTKLEREISFSQFEMDYSDPIDTNTLEPGRAYSIFSKKEISHSLIGVNRPDYNLSVIGNYSPMVVSHNDQLIRAYAGTALRATSSIVPLMQSGSGLHVLS